MKWINDFKGLWETVKPYGALVIAGLMLIGGALASNKYLQLSLESWEVIALILTGVIMMLFGSHKVYSIANRNKLKITQEGEVILIRSASTDAPNSLIKIKIENIGSERSSADKLVGLPLNSDFQDDCLKRKNSSAGAYMEACLGSNVEAHYEQILRLFDEVPKQIGSTKLVKNFMGKGDNIAFIAVTEKNAEGMITTTPINISYATQELVRTARSNQFLEVLCPIFGSGHGGIPAKIALKAMVDGILCAYEILGCNNMTITIKAHHKIFSDAKEIKGAIENA